jgi:hypothetical protein
MNATFARAPFSLNLLSGAFSACFTEIQLLGRCPKLVGDGAIGAKDIPGREKP